jgi:hypothetical protein
MPGSGKCLLEEAPSTSQIAILRKQEVDTGACWIEVPFKHDFGQITTAE